jgi:hypothetical protein
MILFIAVLIFDPVNSLGGAKEVLFIALFAVKLLEPGGIRLSRSSLPLLVLMFLAMAPLGAIVGAADALSIELYLQTLKSFAFVLVLTLIDGKKQEFNRAFIMVWPFFIAFSLLLLALLLLRQRSLATWYIETGNILLGYRDFGTLRIPMVFIKSAPLLVFPMCIGFERWTQTGRARWLAYWLSALIALLASGTRADVIAGVCGAGLLVAGRCGPGKGIALVAAATAIAGPLALDALGRTFFYSGEVSLGVKGGHFESYMDLFANDPGILVYGMGMGRPFYSAGFDSLVYNTELTYFELVRVWGLPLGAAFLFLCFKPALSRSMGMGGKIASLLYLFVAGTNPLLISSTGFLAVTFIHSLVPDDPNHSAPSLSGICSAPGGLLPIVGGKK